MPIFCVSLLGCRDRTKCADVGEDFRECLHHKKEMDRMNAIADERARKQKAGEPVPALLVEDAAAGRLKLPWTNAK